MAYSFLTLAKDVLEKENIPLSIEEMWETAKALGHLEKLSSSGKHQSAPFQPESTLI